jgi:hypothetical protein
MSRTLPVAHQAFVAAIARDTSETELPRLVAVLDALVAWSAARAGVLAFRDADARSDVISFERLGGAGARAVFWSAQVTRGAGPRLEIRAPSERPLTTEERAAALATLNAHSREVLVDGDRLRISFGALKNAAALAAVLALMQQLLTGSGEPAAAAAVAEGM